MTEAELQRHATPLELCDAYAMAYTRLRAAYLDVAMWHIKQCGGDDSWLQIGENVAQQLQLDIKRLGLDEVTARLLARPE